MRLLNWRLGLLLAALLLSADTADAHRLGDLIDCVRDGTFC